MKETRYTICLALYSVCFVIAGCVEKFDSGTLPQDERRRDDTSYVAIHPPFYGPFKGFFVEPHDIMISNDQLLYVADRSANRVVMLNRAGFELSSRTMLHPVSLGQDSRLDLLVGGEIVTPNGDTVGAVFRIHLVSLSPDSAHRLDRARIDTVWRELARPQRRFPSITVFGDNQYLIVRTGPDNSSFVDPDARVLLFNARDVFVTPVPALVTRSGSGISDINFPTSIVSFQGTKDFILAQSSEGVAYGALWFRYEQSSDFEGWLPRFDPARPEDRLVDFIRPNRFVKPEAVTIDKARRDIFIADAELDSVFKFNNRGRMMPESFGRARSGGLMKRPTGLAFFEKILYVADVELDTLGQPLRGKILRFRLSTDVPR